jgi:hypothetical protein
MKIQIIDRKVELVKAFQEAFKDCEDVEVLLGSIFDIKTDCIVSPANSFGFMDGSLDLAISETLGWGIQTRLQKLIQEEHNGELLVGQAVLVETDSEKIPWVISSPTMRVPQIIKNTPNPYLASKAVFCLLKEITCNLGILSIFFMPFFQPFQKLKTLWSKTTATVILVDS